MPKGRKTREMTETRKDAIEAEIAKGITSVREIARVLHGHPGFDAETFEGTSEGIRRYFKKRKLSASQQPRTHASMITAIAASAATSASSIQTFLEKYQIRLPAGQISEFNRFITALTAVARPLEERALRVPIMEERIRELEASVRDLKSNLPTVILEEENRRLRGVIEKQETVIETLKRTKGYRGGRILTPESHLVVSAGRD
ncbi:MAG: hypothetical protein HYW90_01600 [Candidatus Sungbacteria bacterium]|nr:hypothetical protein [Candidatus Sungbacteria bacterium]